MKARWTKLKMPDMEKLIPKQKIADYEEKSEGKEGEEHKCAKEDGIDSD